MNRESATEPQDAKLTEIILRRLELVPGMFERYHSLVGERPAEPSLATVDKAAELGGLVWTFAASAWNGGAGNALTWLQVVRTRLQPFSGHYTLARAALEGAVTSMWLADPDVPSGARRERAARLQAEDHEERRRWENAWMVAHGVSERPSSFNASRRLEEHLEEMRGACLAQGRTLAMADRMNSYAGESWSWRTMSAFAHGMPWSGMLSTIHEAAPISDFAGSSWVRTTSNTMLTATFAITVTKALEDALVRLESYWRGQPAAHSSGTTVTDQRG